MFSKDNIVDGSLAEINKKGYIYTKKGGWIDLGHANPKSPDKNTGSENLWRKVRFEPKLKKNSMVNSYIVRYAQSMGIKTIKIGPTETYCIKRGLSLKEKKSVALAIFLSVSMRFEAFQGCWPYCILSGASSFSCEDLFSNLISFYRAVNPGPRYIERLEPVSREEALKIYDKFGPPSKYKNKFLRPMLFHGGLDKPIRGTVPPFLNSIKPAKRGKLFVKSNSTTVIYADRLHKEIVNKAKSYVKDYGKYFIITPIPNSYFKY